MNESSMQTRIEGYFATISGDIISTKCGKQRVLRACSISEYGHQCVTLSRQGKRTTHLVHRLIWEAFNGAIGSGMEIDHIDRNPRNNRLDNLRLATRTENARNNSGHKRSLSTHVGVSFHKRRNKWQATIRVEKRLIHLGYFDTEENAAQVRYDAALKYFGEYAPR